MVGKRKARTTSLKSSIAALLLGAAFLLQSCDGTLFHSFKSVGNMEWSRCDTLEFTYSNSRAGAAVVCAGMSIEVRHTASYRFKNLLVRAEVLNSCDSTIVVDTLSCVIYDDNGIRCGSTTGTMYQQSSEPSVFHFPQADTLKIRLSHIMDEERLQGVCDVGIKLVESSAPCRHQF